MKKLIAILLLLLSACASMPSGSGNATPIVITAEMGTVLPDGGGSGGNLSTPKPTAAVPTEWRYRILEEFPDFFYCDPDYYPVAREEETVLAQQRFPELQANQAEFQAILAHNGLSGSSTFTDDQKLLIYREHKKLNAIYMEMVGDVYRFQIQTGSEGQEGRSITGTIDGNGSIDIVQDEPSFPTCPICLAEGTLIDTPRGAIRVEELRVGDSVWTVNEAGERVEAVILQAGLVRVPARHQVVHVQLNDGRELWASAGHPTAEGNAFAHLKPGDPLDGATVVLWEEVPYGNGFTFDILPSGETGLYWANGILIASSLKK